MKNKTESSIFALVSAALSVLTAAIGAGCFFAAAKVSELATNLGNADQGSKGFLRDAINWWYDGKPNTIIADALESIMNLESALIVVGLILVASGIINLMAALRNRSGGGGALSVVLLAGLMAGGLMAGLTVTNSAKAAGHWVENLSGRLEHIVIADYPTAEMAADEAVRLCAALELSSMCRTKGTHEDTVGFTKVLTFRNNQAIVWLPHTDGGGFTGIGIGDSVEAAIDAWFEACVGFSLGECLASDIREIAFSSISEFRNSPEFRKALRICADGTLNVAGVRDDCTGRFGGAEADVCEDADFADVRGINADCECSSGEDIFETDEGRFCAAQCPSGLVDNGSRFCAPCDITGANADCECPSGEGVFTTAEGKFCATQLRVGDYVDNAYTESSCFGAGWRIVYQRDTGNRFVECCSFGARRDDAAGPILVFPAQARGEVQPLQDVADGDDVDFCIMRMHDGFDAAAAGVADVPFCNAPDLFGDTGFPQKPEGFADGDRITVSIRENGTRSYSFAGTVVLAYAPAADAVVRAGGGGSSSDVGLIVGGVAVVGLLAWALSDGGTEGEFAFAPDFGYAITESGYSYKYGGRLDFRKDAWSLYWTAGQRNADGDWSDFRIESGGEYDGGFWRAAFSESVVGDVADYDFSLSADWTEGIWRVSPEFAADARYATGDFTVANSFRISGELRVDDWRFAASGNAERVRLSAAREF